MVAPCCDDRLAPVAGSHKRGESWVGRPGGARVEDEDLRAVAEGRLGDMPDVKELEQSCLVRRTRERVVDHVRYGVHDEPLVGI